MTYDNEDLQELVETLRGFTTAYPPDIFAPVSYDERARLHLDYPGFQDRIAASMGRHLAPFMARAAEAIEYLMKKNEPKT